MYRTDLISRAMKRVARQGYNPYDNHTDLSRMYDKVWREVTRREVEKEARRAAQVEAQFDELFI